MQSMLAKVNRPARALPDRDGLGCALKGVDCLDRAALSESKDSRPAYPLLVMLRVQLMQNLKFPELTYLAAAKIKKAR